MRTRTTFKPWLVVSLLMAMSSGAGAEPTAVVQLWTGEPPGTKHVVQGPEQDLTKPTDKLIAGRPIIKLGNVATPEMPVTTWPSRCAEWLRVQGLLVGSNPGHPDR